MQSVVYPIALVWPFSDNPPFGAPMYTDETPKKHGPNRAKNIDQIRPKSRAKSSHKYGPDLAKNTEQIGPDTVPNMHKI